MPSPESQDFLLAVAFEEDRRLADLAALTGSDDPALNRALLDVCAELGRAEAKHGSLPFDRFAQLGILVEEVGEVARATAENRWARPCQPEIRAELVQVAAVALRMIAHLDAYTITAKPKTP